MAQNPYRATALHAAVKAGNEYSVWRLLESESKDLLEVRDVFGLSPLHLAVRLAEFHLELMEPVVEVLLQAGAIPNPRDFLGRSAIQEAARFESETVFDLLHSYIPENTTSREPRDKHWARIRAILSQIFWHVQSVKRKDIMRLYDIACCVMTNGRSSAESAGETLYCNIRDFVTDYVRGVAAGGARLQLDSFSAFYSEEWQRYQLKAKYLSRSFSYLDRHYVRRSQEENKEKIFDVRTMCLVLRKEHFLDVDDRLVQERRVIEKNAAKSGSQDIQDLCDKLSRVLGE